MRLTLSIFLIGLVMLLSQGCSGESQAETSKADKGTAVRTLKIQPRPFMEYIHTTGTVKAKNQIRVVAEESGILDKVYFDKGRRVKRGDILARLDNKIIVAGFKDAEAALEQALINEKSARLLHKKEALSDNDFQLARLNRIRAEAARDIAATRREKLGIKAPISGYINERYVDTGAFVSPGTAIFEIVDLSRFKIVAGIAERFIPYLQTGAPAEVTFDAWPEKHIVATISYVARSIDPENRTFNIEIEIPREKDIPLSPQMMANIRLIKRSVDKGIVIPLDAIIESESGRFVYLKNGAVAQKQNVTIEAINEDRALVSGLQANQELIVVGQRQVADGDTLIVIQD